MKPHHQAIIDSGRRERATVEAIAAAAPEPLYWTAADLEAAGLPAPLALGAVAGAFSTWGSGRILPAEGVAITEAYAAGAKDAADIRRRVYRAWAERRGYNAQ